MNLYSKNLCLIVNLTSNYSAETKVPLLQCMLFFILGMIQVSTSKSPK